MNTTKVKFFLISSHEAIAWDMNRQRYAIFTADLRHYIRPADQTLWNMWVKIKNPEKIQDFEEDFEPFENIPLFRPKL